MLTSVLEVVVKGQTILFIPHQELLDLGYVSLEDFMVVEANERFFELQGYDGKTQLWWVEEIQLPQEDPDPGRSVEAMGEGGSESPRGDAQRPSGE